MKVDFRRFLVLNASGNPHLRQIYKYDQPLIPNQQTYYYPQLQLRSHRIMHLIQRKQSLFTNNRFPIKDRALIMNISVIRREKLCSFTCSEFFQVTVKAMPQFYQNRFYRNVPHLITLQVPGQKILFSKIYWLITAISGLSFIENGKFFTSKLAATEANVGHIFLSTASK